MSWLVHNKTGLVTDKARDKSLHSKEHVPQVMLPLAKYRTVSKSSEHLVSAAVAVLQFRAIVLSSASMTIQNSSQWDDPVIAC